MGGRAQKDALTLGAGAPPPTPQRVSQMARGRLRSPGRLLRGPAQRAAEPPAPLASASASPCPRFKALREPGEEHAGASSCGHGGGPPEQLARMFGWGSGADFEAALPQAGRASLSHAPGFLLAVRRLVFAATCSTSSSQPR
ncbi:unnamed protein product [Prorocentrum cordatum]|uniref:Selenoprotein O n=1 Tax=Prorocentrum cordatum TaxID=2364126 RepID=A0ABN9RYU6_9DINO|nr:unnamed protein product [Polarella glacialis]